ncbi:translation elongation factor Ts [Patescibacteria group bacterium]|nr:translation elongation factor Ts [Patescibacteria group bacterium]MBU1663188.1 translation elongation factor Ts [Patescibacteria group bacterium]MBU1934308.1 translation elongation factor Ts [Patescibacteria group bacterium]MBU2007887.1 translation elongation factor Ts [Patescibacteria group bacterium]MBU2233768.1 translation elongation factor Ts [Patescibacteria group bacterium]
MENIKILRGKTGAGMVDCKKALDESGNDINKAIEILRKKGIAKAAQRSDREAAEGVIKVALSSDAKTGYLVEINAETDFVVRSEKFQMFAEKVVRLIMEKQPKDLVELMTLNFDHSTIKENLDSLSGVIGEKLDIKRYEMLNSAGTVAVYSHMGGRIGVLVALDKEGQSDIAYDVAMQIAAANPKYIRPEDILADEINKEKEIYKEQLLREGKPENMIEKIMAGKLAKFYEEVCLIKQEYIKDDSKKVEDILGHVKVERFIRYSL